LKNIEPCFKTAFREAGIKPKQIDLIAVTVGPGLIPCLLIGVNFAKTLAYAWQKPIIGVNHLEGHLAAIWLSPNRGISNSKFLISKQISNFRKTISKTLLPAICLIVSGGHTQLILMSDFGKYKMLGETRDDAAGECFDKVARLLKLGYPGGPAIAVEAEKSKKLQATSYKLNLPRPMINHKNYDFSFSGLKTAVLYKVRNMKDDVGHSTSNVPALCKETQQAIIDVLIEKTIRAAKEYRAKTIILSGGVAANEELRKQFKLKIVNCKFSLRECRRKIEFLAPTKNLCTDNGAMIAAAGYFKYKSGAKTDWKKIKADANLRLK